MTEPCLLELSIDQAKELVINDIKHVVSTLENALNAIKNPDDTMLNMEGSRAKIYINDGLLKTLDRLEKLQLQVRVNTLQIEHHDLDAKITQASSLGETKDGMLYFKPNN